MIQTDNKLMGSIALKNLTQAPPWLARMLVKVQGYDFAVTYSAGKAVPIADCLSRLSPRPGRHIRHIDFNIHIMNTHLNFSPTHTRH